MQLSSANLAASGRSGTFIKRYLPIAVKKMQTAFSWDSHLFALPWTFYRELHSLADTSTANNFGVA